MSKHEVTYVTEALALQGWVPVPFAADHIQRAEQTVRAWIRQERVRSRVHQGVLYVDIWEAGELSRDTPRQARWRKA